MFAYGWHPKKVLDNGGIDNPVNLERLYSRLGTEGCIGMGEVGLDYSLADGPPKLTQKLALEKLLPFAKR